MSENYCVECGVAMGPHNPRQLCGKWKCHTYPFGKPEESEVDRMIRSFSELMVMNPFARDEYKECGHMCCISSMKSCCMCMDTRPLQEEGTYPVYVDQIGTVYWGRRAQHYCPICK